MFSYLYMKILESSPERYDRGIALASLGGADRAREAMVADVGPGDRVADLGTGTGSLALLAAGKGAEVTGIDANAGMLAVARKKLGNHPASGRVRFVEAGVAEMDEVLEAGAYTVVTASLLFSELSPDERRYALAEAYRALAPGGRLVIADETRPAGFFRRLVYGLARLLMVFLSLVLVQAGTRPVDGLPRLAREAGFEVDRVEITNRLGSFFILWAHKPEAP